MEQKIILSPKKIVAKEFKVDFKGYNAEEVDHFLDIIVKDYETFAAMLNASYDKIDQLESRLNEQKIKTFYTSSGDISIKSDGENIYFIQK